MSEDFESSKIDHLSPFNFKIGAPLTDYYSEDDIKKFEFREANEAEKNSLEAKYRDNYKMYKITKPNYNDTFVSVFGDNKIIYFVAYEKLFNNSKSVIDEAMSMWEKFDQYFETTMRIKQINKQQKLIH